MAPEKKSPDNGALDESGLSSLKLILNYLCAQYGSQFSMSDIGFKPNGTRFWLEKQGPVGAADLKYSRITFYTIHDQQSGDQRRVVIKRNKIILDPQDTQKVTELEGKILQALKHVPESIRVPTVDCYGFRDDLLLLGYVNAKTVEEISQQAHILPPEVVVSILESMPQLHMALDYIFSPERDFLTDFDREYLRNRPIRLIQKDIAAHEDEIRAHFYTYRLLHAVAREFSLDDVVKIETELKESYLLNNESLKSAPQKVVCYSHGANKFLVRAGPEEEGQIVHGDFNHIVWGPAALDTAMSLFAIGPETWGKMSRAVNYFQFALLTNFLALQENLNQGDRDYLTGIRDSIRDAILKGTGTISVDIDRLYDIPELSAEIGRQYYALMQRAALDLIKAAGSPDKADPEHTGRYRDVLRYVGLQAQKFSKRFDSQQRENLASHKLYLPISLDSLAPLRNVPQLQRLLRF